MTSAAALKSASFALKAFLEDKPVGYEFTVDSLREDFMTDPKPSMQLSRGAVSGFVSKAYARKAFTRQRVGAGHIRKYKLVDVSLIFVKNRRSAGKAPGVHPAKPFKQMPDTEQIAPSLVASSGDAWQPGKGGVIGGASNFNGGGGGGSGGGCAASPVSVIVGKGGGAGGWGGAAAFPASHPAAPPEFKGPPPRLHVPVAIAEKLTRDTMLGAIREIVDAHLAAFEANRPAPAFPDSIACAARHGADLLPHISTDAILAELKRRADHG